MGCNDVEENCTKHGMIVRYMMYDVKKSRRGSYLMMM